MAKLIKRDHPKFPYIVRWWKPDQHQKSFATRREALAFLPEAEGIERGGKAETFRAYACRWLAQVAPSRRASYVRSIDKLFKAFILPAIGDMPLDQITREICKALILDPELTPGNARNVGMLVNAVLNEAVRDKLIPDNPAYRVKAKYHAKRAEIVPVTFDQLEVVSASLKNWGLALWLQYGLGLRIGEALAARADGVRADGTVFRVEEQIDLNRVASDEIRLVPMKHRAEGDYRDIPLPSWLKARIDQHIKEYDIPPGGYLFPELADGSCHKSTYYLRFRNGKAKAGIPELHPHMLRHMFASVMLRNKVPITEVSWWLGHRNIQLTFDTYSHMMPSSASEARAKSDDAMAEFRSTDDSVS